MLKEDLVASRARLASSVRALIETVVARRISPEAAERAVHELAEVEARLESETVEINDSSVMNVSGFGREFSPASGTANPVSPPLNFRRIQNGVIATITLNEVYQGPHGWAHGGVVAMIFHEVLGEASRTTGRLGVSAYLDVQYRRPLPLHVPLRIQATVVSTEKWKTTITGSISADTDNAVHLSTATAMFVFPRS